MIKSQHKRGIQNLFCQILLRPLKSYLISNLLCWELGVEFVTFLEALLKKKALIVNVFRQIISENLNLKFNAIFWRRYF